MANPKQLVSLAFGVGHPITTEAEWTIHRQLMQVLRAHKINILDTARVYVRAS